MVAAQGHQCSKGDFGCIAHMGKHGLPIHGLAERHAVQTADELAIDPGFYAVGQTLRVQTAISVDDAGHDPGAILPRACGVCTVLHDLAKAGVDAHFTAGCAQKLA